MHACSPCFLFDVDPPFNREEDPRLTVSGQLQCMTLNGRLFWPAFVRLGRQWGRSCPLGAVAVSVRPTRGRTPNHVRGGRD